MKADGSLQETVVHIETPFGIPIEDIYDGVHEGPVLGSGVSGIVRLVKHKTTGIEYAVKAIDLGLIENELMLDRLRNEIYIMCEVDHPNIVRLDEVYESVSEIYLVQELCLGGDLFDRLDEQPDYHYTENQCAHLVKQMLSSVRYLHSKKVIHRDLKLENFIFSCQKPDSQLKMIDFGLSKHFQFGEVHHEAVGTPYTVAPEVLKGTYDERCDIWAIGVIAYLLLSGETPFGGCDGEDLGQVRKNILCGRFLFEPRDIWKNVSENAKDFIKTLLVVDYRDRPSAKQAQKHPWIQTVSMNGNRNNGSLHGNGLNPNVVQALVSFKEYSDMRKLLCEVLSFTLLPEQIMDLRVEFEKLDTNGDGEISLMGLKQVLIENAEAGSLGALTEEEVEDIFNALRVRKTETSIRWHEFIAAGLSQCEVDERNLKLAFERLDTDRKGYITFENVMNLIGSGGDQKKDDVQRMWVSSINDCKCEIERIMYDDFLLLMKGQTREVGILKEESFARRFKGLQVAHEDYLTKTEEVGVTSEHVNQVLVSAGAENAAISKVDSFAPSEEKISADRPAFKKPTHIIHRSRSMDHKMSVPMVTEDEKVDKRAAMVKMDSLRALLDTKSPLVINKVIYRAHREMRLAVLEASKRFEEKQAQRKRGAGLVMRRGSISKEATKQHREREMIEKARRCGGRTQKYRTASDLSGMILAGPSSSCESENLSEHHVR